MSRELDSVYFFCRLKKKNLHLHLVFEDVCVTIHAAVFFQFAQDDAFFKEKDLSLVPSRGRLHFWILLPHCKESLERKRGWISIYKPYLFILFLKTRLYIYGCGDAKTLVIDMQSPVSQALPEPPGELGNSR